MNGVNFKQLAVELRAELDAQRLRADTAEAENRILRHSNASYLETVAKVCDMLGIDLDAAKHADGKPSDVLFFHAKSLAEKFAAAEQRIASIAGKSSKCKECGSDALFWFDSNTNTSGIMEGRLRTNEVTCTFVLGCADCSATIKTVRAETIAARMTAALNPNPEAESHG